MFNIETNRFPKINLTVHFELEEQLISDEVNTEVSPSTPTQSISITTFTTSPFERLFLSKHTHACTNIVGHTHINTHTNINTHGHVHTLFLSLSSTHEFIYPLSLPSISLSVKTLNLSHSLSQIAAHSHFPCVSLSHSMT